MGSKEKTFLMVDELREDCIKKGKKGLHFILTSVILWAAIFMIHMTSLPILTKNMCTFCCSALLFPIAYLISKIIKVDFQNKDNPLTGLGILFSVNQMLYILIAMWVYAAVPDKMVMVYAMIFGAHLLPYGWMYKSEAYYVFSIVIPVGVMAMGLLYPPSAVAGAMLLLEIVFCACLVLEVKNF